MICEECRKSTFEHNLRHLRGWLEEADDVPHEKNLSRHSVLLRVWEGVPMGNDECDSETI